MGKIIITGSSGFIGRELALYLSQENYNIYAFQRKPLKEKFPNIQFVPYSLSTKIEDHYFQEADILIHTAYQKLNPKEDDVNYSGTKIILKKCRQYQVKFIFLSTVSAQKNIPSRYAISKLNIENLLDKNQDTILKLGLVIGNNGLFFSMYTIIKKLKIVPIFDNGKQHVQYISITDVTSICKYVIEQNSTGSYVITHHDTILMKELYQKLAHHQQKKRIFISIPSKIAYFTLKGIEKLNIQLPITSENIAGLQNTTKLSQKLPLGISKKEIKSFDQSLERLP